MKKVRITWIFLFAIVCLAAAMLMSIMAGSYTISVQRVIETILGNGSKADNMAVLQIRLPRIITALLVGIALSASGSVLQTVTKNPLAEPGMIGINAGAALAVVLFITSNTGSYYETLSHNKQLLMPLVAILGALLASILIYSLTYRNGIAPIRLILVGIGINAGINAIISYYQLTSSKGDYNQVLTWTSGSLWGSSWMYVRLIAPVVLILFLILMWKANVLDAMQLGDEMATGLGMQVQRESFILFFLAAILAAVATSIAGNIAFLGLLGPQLAKRFVGGRHRLLIPLGGIFASLILILADVAARNLFSPLEIPVGIAVAILGVPYFVYLLLKEK